MELIDKILNTEYVDNAGIDDLRKSGRNCVVWMKYIPKVSVRYDTNFEDDLLVH